MQPLFRRTLRFAGVHYRLCVILATCVVVGFSFLTRSLSENAAFQSKQPANLGQAFRILDQPVKIPGGWRVTWESISGTTYQVQRTANDQLNTTNWIDIATVTATGALASFDDLTSASKRFYRIKLTPGSTLLFGGNSDQWVPLNGGIPAEGAQLTMASDGQLAPFEYRPAGRSLAGAGQGLFIRFPQGARVVSNGVPRLEFTSATASFGTNSAFQFETNLVVSGTGIRQLPLGPLDVASLASAFGLPPTNGLDVLLFTKFPLTIRKGVFDESGLREGQISVRNPGLPLPGSSGLYSDLVIELTPKGGVRIPFAGRFALPDNSEAAPTLTVATNRPLWVEFKPSGSIAMAGRADLNVPNGPSFTVDMRFDDPHYDLQISAKAVHVPLLESFFDLLPPTPTVPSSTDSAQLDLAQARLASFDNAMVRVSAASVGSAPATRDSQQSIPNDAFCAASAVLDAWGFAAASGGTIPSASLNGALRHASESASAARDLQTILDQRLSLLRLKKAFHDGSVGADPTVQAELEAALAKTLSALVSRAKERDAVSSLENMQAAMSCILQIETLTQQLGLQPDPQLTPALADLLKQFTDDFTSSLGVQPGAFSLTTEGSIARMDQFTAMDNLRQFAQVLTIAQQLGLDSAISAPVDESLSQLGLRLWQILDGALTQAESAGDYAAFTFALEDTLDFVALRQSGIFPNRPELAGLPDQTTLNSLAQRLGNIFTLDMARPAGERSLLNLRRDFERLTKILRQLPAGISYPPASIQRACDQIDTRLLNAFTDLSKLSLSDLGLVLAAGIAKAEIRDRFNFTETVSWENVRLPLLVAQIATRAQSSNAWSELHADAHMLLTEASRLSQTGNQSRRKLYLQQAGQLLTTSRAIAIALWQEEVDRRNGTPIFETVDMLLPGDIYIDRVAGSLRYHRGTRDLYGAFSGQMRLPKFNLQLTVENASFSSGGAFDLNAFGNISLPPNNSTVSLSIPARRPLRISFRPPNNLSIAAGARMAMANGIALESYISLNDPVYSFGIAGEGLRFDLATNMIVMMPTFPEADKFGPEIGRILNDYYQGLNASLDSLSGLTNSPQWGEIGTPPEFQESTVVLPTEPLMTWANGVLIDLTNNVIRDYSATTNAIRSQLAQLAQDTRAQRDQLEHSEVFLRGIAMCNLHKTMLIKASKAAAANLSAEDAEAIINSPEMKQYVQETLEAAKRLMTRQDSTLLSNYVAVCSAVMSVAKGLECANDDESSTNLMAAFSEYQTRNFNASMDSLGIDPETGKPKPGSTTFTALTPEQLMGAFTNLLNMGKNYQMIGQPEPPNQAIIRQTLAIRYRHILMERLGKLSSLKAQDHPEIGRITMDLFKLNIARQGSGFTFPSEPILQLDGSYKVIGAANDDVELNENIMGTHFRFARMLETNNAEATAVFCALPKAYREDLFGWKGLAAIAAKSPQPIAPANSALAQFLNRAFAKQLSEVEYKLQSSWTTERMAEGVKLLDELVKLASWAQVYDPPSLPTIRNLIATNLTVKMLGSARAKTNSWLLNRYIQIAIDAAEQKVGNDANALRDTFFGTAQSSLQASAQIAESLKLLLPQQRPFDLRLPGDVFVRRAAGSITYNRETEYLQGSFSGRLEFPDLQNAFFEIDRATIDNQLNFSISAASSGPLPFDGVTLTASVVASNGPNQTLAFSGSGTLKPTNGPNLNVNLAFNTETRTLSFDTQAGDLESWRLNDNLVLFDAGFGFTITPEAQAGQFRVNGSAGFFAKNALPATGQITPSHFHLFADNVRSSVTIRPGQIELTFSNGILHLPEIFTAGLCENSPESAGPTIALSPDKPVRATFLQEGANGQPQVKFTGALEFENIGIKVPDVDGLGAELCSARLLFDSSTRPVLTNLNGVIEVPLPPGQSSRVEILEGAWSLDGLPSGKIALANDITLLDVGGMKFTLLGMGSEDCPRGTALEVFPAEGDEVPRFVLDGGMQLTLPAGMLTGADGDAARVTTCGSVSATPPGLPSLTLDKLAFGGNFHLGGAGGILLSNANIELNGVQNVFDLSEAKPLVVVLEGTAAIPNGPAFTLKDTSFTFYHKSSPPRFSTAGFGCDLSQVSLAQSLPASVDKIEIDFKNRNLDLPEYLSPTNIVLTTSAHVQIPPDSPAVAGQIDNVKLSINERGMLQIESIAGLMLKLASVDIPPIKDIGGELYIGGLEDPPKMYFAGRAGGNYDGYKVNVLLAFNLAGPIGLCFDLNAGSVGIPLDGYYLGGILLTGASGGEHFLNSNGDPCKFTTFMNDGAPLSTFIEVPEAMSWKNFKAAAQRAKDAAQAFVPQIPKPTQLAKTAFPRTAPDKSVNGFDCPEKCPPPTVNIFCQPHPDSIKFPKRVILKFSSIDEKTLNGLGISPESMDWLGTETSEVATNVAHFVREHVREKIGELNVAITPSKREKMEAVIDQTLDAAEEIFVMTLTNALAAASRGNRDAIYPAIRDTLYAGVPCPDVTMMVSGTFTHSVVSSFLSGTVGATVSTSGAAGVVGEINVLGIPTGTGKLFVAGTDDRGLPNPSVSGEIDVTFGPVSFGNLRAEMVCRDCISGLLQDFFKLAQCLSEPVIRQIMARAAPRLASLNVPPDQLLQQLTDIEKLAFMAQVYQLPPETVAGFPACFKEQFRSMIDSLQPYMVLCGQATPKLFGIPLADKLMEAAGEVSKTNIAFIEGYSASKCVALSMMLTGTALSEGALAGVLGAAMFLFPVQDYGEAGFNLSIPDPAEALFAGLSGRLASSNAVFAYASSNFDRMLQESTYTFKQDVSLLGFKALSTQARMILPNLTNHPARPHSGWVMPELRTNNAISRMDVLLAALNAGKLADPFWAGTPGEMEELFPGDSRISGLDFRKDYFPHGGYAGAFDLDLPVALTQTPPDYLPALLDPTSSMNVVDRLMNTLDYLQNYVMAFTNQGAVAFYYPAPNPPYFTNSAGNNLGPKELLNAICSFDWNKFTNAQVTTLYPIDLAFYRGYFTASLLGVPLANGSVYALPPSEGEHRTNAVVRVEVNATPEGWLSHFVKTNNLLFDMHSSPPRPIEAWANDAYIDLLILAANPDNLSTEELDARIEQRLRQIASSLATNLPKVQLEADLAVTLPEPISNLVQFTNSVILHAYSPAYNPGYQPESDRPLARIKREGGIAFEGVLKLKAGPITLADIPSAELSVIPRGTAALPELAGHLDAPAISYEFVTISNVLVDFTSHPSAHFTASGKLVPFCIGGFKLNSDTNSELAGRLNVASQSGNQVSVNLSVNPAVLELTGFGNKLLIHGATRNDPFTFSTDGPWTASLEFTNTLNFLDLVEFGMSSAEPGITLQGDGNRSASFRADFVSGAALVLFPRNADLRRDVTLSSTANGYVQVNSDGTFVLSGKLGSGTSLNGIPIPADATLTITESGVAITWSIDGAANATVNVDRSGKVTFNGTADLPPLVTGVFKLTGADGGNLRGSFSEKSFVVESGAKLTLTPDWLQNQSLTLSSFMLNSNGSISISATNPGNSLLFAGFPFDLTAFTFQRNATNSGNGEATLGLAGTLKTNLHFPGFPQLSFTGTVSSLGSVSLSSYGSSTKFFGFPVRGMTNYFGLEANKSKGKLQTAFSLGDGSSPMWDKVGTNWFSGELNPDGAFTIQSTAPNLNLVGFSLTNVVFRLARISGQNPSAELDATLSIPGMSPCPVSGNIGANGNINVLPRGLVPFITLPYPNLGHVELSLTNSGAYIKGVLGQAPLPSMILDGRVQPSGAFALTNTSTTLQINGFSFSNSKLIIRSEGPGDSGWLSALGDLVVPALGTYTVDGGFTNDGTFRLAANLGNMTFTDLPIDVITNPTLVWSDRELTLSGAIGGGILTKVPVPPSITATGSVNIAPGTGLKTLSASLAVQGFTNTLFTLRPATGSTFAGSLDNTGLTLPAGGVFQCSNYFAVPLPMPEIRIAADGSFSAQAGTNSPLSLTWAGFGLNNVALTLTRDSSGVIKVPLLEGDLDVPGLQKLVQISGSLTNNGKFKLCGSFGTDISLNNVNPSLPISTLGADATLCFSNGVLFASGSIGGGVLQNVPLSGYASGTLTITPAPTVSLSGTVNLSPLRLGNFQIESTATGGGIGASWENNALRLPSNLRLLYNNAVLGTANLPPFPLNSGGDFSFTHSNVLFNLAGFVVSNASYTFNHSGTLTSLAVNSGTLYVPGLKAQLPVSISGSLSSDGTYSLHSTANTVSLASLGSVISVASGATVSFQNGTTIISGTLTGGVLGYVNVVGSASGGLSVVASSVPAVVTPYGSVTVAPFDFGAFKLQPVGGGNFVASMSSQGLVLPTGAQIVLNGSVLGNFSLPPITIPAGGDFTGNLNNISIKLLGFDLNNVNLTYQRSGAAFSLPSMTGTLKVPTLDWDIPLSGAIPNTGLFDLANNTFTNRNLSNLPVPLLSGAPKLRLLKSASESSLTVSGGLSGGILNYVPEWGSVTGLVTVASSGRMDLGGTITLQAINAWPFSITDADEGNFTAFWTNSGIYCSGLRLAFAQFEPSIALPAFTIPANGDFFLQNIRPPSMNIAGLPCKNIALDFYRTSSQMRIPAFRFQFDFPAAPLFTDFNKYMQGSIGPDGFFDLQQETLGLWVSSFQSTLGKLTLRGSSPELTALCPINLTAFGRTVVTNLNFSGRVFSATDFNLSPLTNITWFISNLAGPSDTGSHRTEGSASGAWLALTETGINGQDTLQFGDGRLPMVFTNWTSSGLTLSGSKSWDSNWKTFSGTGVDPVQGRLQANIKLNASPTDVTFSCKAETTFSWRVGYSPAYIDQGSKTLSFDLKTDGKIDVRESHGSVDLFDFDMW